MTGLNTDFHFFFEYKEFDSPDEVGSYINMDVGFLNKLAAARKAAAIGFKITWDETRYKVLHRFFLSLNQPYHT